MAIIKSGATSDQLTIDATSKAARATLYDTAGRALAYESLPTFVSAGSFTPVATPADLLTIFGSASKTVRVLSILFGTTNTAAGSQQFFLSKRSAVTTGGTAVAQTIVPLDSTDAATATVSTYSVDPTPGAVVGNINVVRVASPAAIPASFAGVVTSASFQMLPYDYTVGLCKPVVLRGVAQGLAVNFNDVALVAGQTHVFSVLWTEE